VANPHNAVVHREQRALAAEAVNPECRDKSAGRRGKRVGGDERGELPRVDGEQPHQLRRERHHDHEIDDVGELHAGQRQQQQQFTR
jgi:hypothetical protein